MNRRIIDDEIDDAALHERAEQGAAQRQGEPDADTWAYQLVASYQPKIAAARRALLPEAVLIERAASTVPTLAALSREAPLARIAQLIHDASATGLRYRDLGEQSDDDLRQTVAALAGATSRKP